MSTNTAVDASRKRQRPEWNATEFRRRLWHMLPGLLPFLLWAFPHRDPISPTLRWILVGVVVALALHVWLRYRLIARPGDREQSGAVLGYAGSVLVMLLAFPAHAELGLTVLAVLAFGDGSATLGGLLCGGARLPWNPRKSWAGLVSFLAVGMPAASVIYWGETYFNPEALAAGGVPFWAALICGGSATLAGAIAETLPVRLNDNVRVGAAAALAVVAAHSLTVGWN
ncbi:MAG: hypothetical protein KY476_20635 [Planctomycetes bacterium]|nr:hypothetical protein [Planctomycetota bacterium]